LRATWLRHENFYQQSKILYAMRIISLNTLMGEIFEPLMAFVEREAPRTDVFCFQEIVSAVHAQAGHTPSGVRLNELQELCARLPEYTVSFFPVQDDLNLPASTELQMQYGMALFVHTRHTILDQGHFFICNGFNTYVPRDYSLLGSGAQYIRLPFGTTSLTICNIHGVPLPGDKLDTPKRIAQSQKILDTLRTQPGEQIITGDFNLLPETESVRVFERAGFRNLISEYQIKTTRGTLIKQLNPEYAHGPNGFQEFADYTFVSPKLHVTSFEVPDLPISDHLPMILDISS
jgi:hypothetical protein